MTLKATLRCAVLLALVAIGMLATSMPSFAEVQNIKVGGDITVRAFHRENLDLNQNAREGSPAAGDLEDEDDFIQQTTALNVGADLTENVSAFVRITNERTYGLLSSSTTAADGDFDISQGYVKLKELFYTPLTATIGTQPITWGRGFVVGSNLITSIIGAADDRHASLAANEFTDFTAFDAIRLQADFGGTAAMDMPLTIDGIYVKNNERIAGSPDDETTMGLNIGTRLDAANSEFETYFLNRRDKSQATTSNAIKDTSVTTFGVRGSAKPTEGTYVYGELGYQWGTRDADPDTTEQAAGAALAAGDAHQAWAANLGADHTFTDISMTPKLGGEWIFFSGKDIDGAANGWDPMLRGYFTTAIREFQTADGVGGFYATNQRNVTGGASNQHQLSLYGSFNPIEDLTVSPRLSWFILHAGAIPCAGVAGCDGKRKHHAGTEWDTVVNYAYTEDVSFGMIYALFWPGNTFRTAVGGGAASRGGDSTAQELITSVSVKF